MFSTALSAAVNGLHVSFITVEVDIRNGLPSFQMVGYLSAEVREAGERVRAAIQNSGYSVQPMKILVNLSPADLRKRGTAFDLPVAAGILAALEMVPAHRLKSTVILGELSLNGEVKSVPGILPVVMEAEKQGYTCCIVPEDNRKEAEAVSGIRVAGVRTLNEMAAVLKESLHERKTESEIGENPEKESEKKAGKEPVNKDGWPGCSGETCITDEDYCDIYGQEAVKRAIEIAVAGGHNLLMIGPPGSGKSMLARRIPSILPPLEREESLEISKIYSIRGMLDSRRPLVIKRPFRQVHHSITRAALVGGGGSPVPGEISLASGGVLFLDELPEMSRTVVESLRQPLEERQIQITRSRGTYRFPADCLLVCAMNPCPCGNYPDLNRCRCTGGEIDRYLSKISRPFLERLDVCIEVPDVSYQEIRDRKTGKSSAEMRREIVEARKRQKERYREEKFSLNAQMKGSVIEKYCRLGEEEEAFMEKAFYKLHLSVRTYHNILKVARTIADLEDSRGILLKHLQEAAGYRMTDLRKGGFHEGYKTDRM